MNERDFEVRLSTNVGEETHPSAKAMNDILKLMMGELEKHLTNRKTRLSELPPQALIVMITNNVLMNMFLQCYTGSKETMIEDARTVADHVKKTFLDCIEKVVLSNANKDTTH